MRLALLYMTTSDFRVPIQKGKSWRVLRDTMRRLKEDRDEALALLDRVEASRNELARQQGHYKGRIAKVETMQQSRLHSLACRRDCEESIYP